MKKFLLIALAMILTIGVGSFASAQSKGVNFSGEIELDAVTRDNVEDFDSDTSDTRAFVHAEVTLNAEADLGSNVKGVIQLENRQGTTPTGGASLIGDANSFGLEVEQAYIEAKEFFHRNLTAKAGIVDVVYDLRGNGDCFALNLADNGTTDDAAVGGWLTRYDAAPVVVDLWMLTMADTGIDDQDNSDIYGLVVDYEKEKNLFRFMLMYNNDRSGFISGGNKANWVNVGLGADYWVLENLEVYGELGYQAGEFSDTSDHSALAFYIGAMYNFKAKYSPSVELSIWYYGGDEAGDVDSDNWYNMGNVNNTVIVEEGQYGLGYNTNLFTVRLEGGIKPTDQSWVGMSYNYLALNEELVAGGDTDLGHEIDIRGTYDYTADLKVGLNLGIVMPGDALGTDSDTAFLVNLDTTLKF